MFEDFVGLSKIYNCLFDNEIVYENYYSVINNSIIILL